MENIYTLKVYPQGLGNKVYRIIKLSGSETLHMLSYAILECFDFDHSHMYEFSMDGELYREYNYLCYPENGEPDTNIELDKLNLTKKQKFYFHYDFGDDWVFVITVQDIAEGEHIEPTLIKGKGDVEQYPEWEEE